MIAPQASQVLLDKPVGALCCEDLAAALTDRKVVIAHAIEIANVDEPNGRGVDSGPEIVGEAKRLRLRARRLNAPICIEN